MKQIRPKRAPGQTWKTFLCNHVAETWACDFLQVTDLFFRSLFAFFIIELKSRKIMHVNVTRSPCNGYLGHPFKKQARREGERSPSPLCKHRRVGVQSDVVNSLPMLEQRHSYMMEKLLLWVVF